MKIKFLVILVLAVFMASCGSKRNASRNSTPKEVVVETPKEEEIIMIKTRSTG